MSMMASDLRKLALGKQVPDVSTLHGGYRRVNAHWLGTVASRMERLEKSLAAIVEAWESIPENIQVPEEINVNELWDEARAALAEK